MTAYLRERPPRMPQTEVAARQFLRTTLASGVMRTITGVHKGGQPPIIRIAHYRPDGEQAGHILIGRAELDIVTRAINASRSEMPGRVEAGTFPPSASGNTLQVWSYVHADRRGSILLAWTSAAGKRLGRPTALSSEDVDALADAVTWLRRMR